MNGAWKGGDHARRENFWCVEKRIGPSGSEIKEIELLNVKTNHQAKPSTPRFESGLANSRCFFLKVDSFEMKISRLRSFRGVLTKWLGL